MIFLKSDCFALAFHIVRTVEFGLCCLFTYINLFMALWTPFGLQMIVIMIMR